MSTTKQEFKDLAAEIFDEFADFAQYRTFSAVGATGTLDPNTGIITGGSEITEQARAIRVDYTAQDIDGQKIQSDDFELLVQNSDLIEINLRAESARVSVDGVSCRIVSVEIDAADAVVTLQVRP